ncbi:MAG: tRNA pseudouridine(55) synthase TruB, partial [Acholeplasmataceae bacterium]
MDGILLIDKKNQMTSFDVIRQLRKKLGIKKIGHAGTLDPFATGLLIILIGKATKLSDYLLNDDKTYESVFTFGSHTDTYDITGQILRESEYIPTLKDINVAMKTLESYEQEPPMYSAIKMNGQKLVDLARKGK